MRFFGRKKKKEEKKKEIQEIPDLEEILKEIGEFFGKHEMLEGAQAESIFEALFEKALREKMKEASGDNSIEEIAPGHYKVKHVTSGTSENRAEGKEEVKSRSEEEKKEEKELKNLSRDEILLEILKELKELNSNVKALIVRMDVAREETRQLIEDATDTIRTTLIVAGGC